MNFKTLIVDDEPLARERLIRLLQDYNEEIDITAQAANGNEALEMLRNEQFDLVFLDIQMPGMTGLELLKRLQNPPMIIFTTAFDQYAVKAFEENAIDYLLKPIERDRLKKTIEKLKRLKENKNDYLQHQLKAILESVQRPLSKKFPVKVGDSVIFLEYGDIYYFRAEEKIVTVNTHEDEYICSETLTQLEKKLPADIFVRCHRSAIVNINKIKKVQRWFAGKYRIIMTDKRKSELPLSRDLKKHFGF